MNIFLIFGLVILWLVPGIVTAGFAFAFLQGCFKLIAAKEYKSDQRFTRCVAVFGPVTLIAYWITGLVSGYKVFSYGWRLK